jgi:hypothetical protein
MRDIEDTLAELYAVKWHDAISCGSNETQADAAAAAAVTNARRALTVKSRQTKTTGG